MRRSRINLKIFATFEYVISFINLYIPKKNNFKLSQPYETTDVQRHDEDITQNAEGTARNRELERKRLASERVLRSHVDTVHR